MAERLTRELARAGLTPDAAEPVQEAYRLAMERRATALSHEKHPAFLHPGRTVLILLRDAEERTPRHLAAAAALDTWWDELEPSEGSLTARAGDGAALLRASVPRPTHPLTEETRDAVTEALVLAEGAVRRVALAERLDHLRHLHLLGPADGVGPERGRTEHHLACTVYLPLAARTHPTLERRFRHWCRVFGERLEGWNPSGKAG